MFCFVYMRVLYSLTHGHGMQGGGDDDDDDDAGDFIYNREEVALGAQQVLAVLAHPQPCSEQIARDEKELLSLTTE